MACRSVRHLPSIGGAGGEAPLYIALDRLTEAGLVEVVRDEVVNGRARRYYRLTGPGREAPALRPYRQEHEAEIVSTLIEAAEP
jgi:DNA-binding PadR family transcriptional regulator